MNNMTCSPPSFHYPELVRETTTWTWPHLFALLVAAFLRRCVDERAALHRVHGKMIRQLSRHPWFCLQDARERFHELPWDVHTSRRGAKRRARTRPVRHSLWHGHVDYVAVERCMANGSVSIQACKRLSRHADVPLALVLAFPTLPWNWNALFRHHAWRVDQLQRLLATQPMTVRWKHFSHNPHLSCAFLLHFLDQPWDWAALSKNPRFPPQDVHDIAPLCNKWKWRSALSHFRMAPTFWLHVATRPTRTMKLGNIRNVLQWETTFFAPLLRNTFHRGEEAREWATHILRRWLRERRRRRHHLFFARTLLPLLSRRIETNCLGHALEYAFAPPPPHHTTVLIDEMLSNDTMTSMSKHPS
ncbi:hypothetical protein EBZ80_22740 [bacterium]|nr:hypothetical protein [bacterium]